MPAIQRILVVDDEATIVMSLGHYLRGLGADVVECQSREEALAALGRGHFDIALVDLRLSPSPTLEGLEIVEEIRLKHPETFVLVMTAYGSDEIRPAVLNRGAFCVYQKPLNLDHLGRTLTGLVPPVPAACSPPRA